MSQHIRPDGSRSFCLGGLQCRGNAIGKSSCSNKKWCSQQAAGEGVLKFTHAEISGFRTHKSKVILVVVCDVKGMNSENPWQGRRHLVFATRLRLADAVPEEVSGADHEDYE
jgi:hypothetical protein